MEDVAESGGFDLRHTFNIQVRLNAIHPMQRLHLDTLI